MLPEITTKIDLLFEGGNVFSETDSIPKEYIQPTLSMFVDEMNKYFRGLLDDYKTLGSVGKKSISGDIDLAISSEKFFDENGKPRLKEFNIAENQFNAVFEKYKSRAKTSTDEMLMRRTFLFFIYKKINDSSKLIEMNDKGTVSGALFCKFPQFDGGGNQTDKFVQIDLNFGNIDWLSFSYYSDIYKDNVKGLHRTQLMLSLFSYKGYIFNHNYGIKEKESGNIVASNVEQAIAVLNKIYGFTITSDILSNYFKLHEFLKTNLDKNSYNGVIDIYLKILDSTRADIPLDLQKYWIENKDRLGLRGIFLPDDSKLKSLITESGVAGGSRIPNNLVKAIIDDYIKTVLKPYQKFVSVSETGGTKTAKADHGDIDIIVNLNETDIATDKSNFTKYISSLSNDIIVPFKSEKYAGKKYYASGELISVLFHSNNLYVQVDNNISLSEEESKFKEGFLNMPADKQGLIIGLVRVATAEESYENIFRRMGIKASGPLDRNERYEFVISGQKLSLRFVVLSPEFKELERKELWSSRNWDDVKLLLNRFDLDSSFDALLQQTAKIISAKSKARIKGLFRSMVTVKSGEVGTQKAINKQNSIKKIESL